MTTDTPAPPPETLEATEAGGKPRKWTLVLVVFQVGLAVGGLKLWRRFQGVTEGPRPSG